MKIEVFSHSVKVSEVSQSKKQIVESFFKPLIQYEQETVEGKKTMVATKVYAYAGFGREYYRFHINLFKDFIGHLKYRQVPEAEYLVVYRPHELTDDHRVVFRIKSMFDPLEHQPMFIDYILSDGPNKIINLQTGKGKTFITKYCLEKMGLRAIAFMKSSYIDRWIPDLEETFKFKSGELLDIRGGNALRGLLEMDAEDRAKIKMILISTTTMNEYIGEWQRERDTFDYPVSPEEFYDFLKIGVSVLDEGHQFLHQIMRIFSFAHVHKFITLSATLETRDPFITRMLQILYPLEERFGNDYYDPFIAVKALHYGLHRPRNHRYTGYGGAYNHNTFEASLLTKKNKVELKNYLDMIVHYVNQEFMSTYQPGQKMIIFCGTVNMCTVLTKYLQSIYRRLKVARYVSKDKATALQENDIVVSTVLSAGTAVDIPNLAVTLMTTAIDSQQSNEQTLGRTRKLKSFPDYVPKFLYFVCTMIGKHVDYHRRKIEYFRGKVVAHGMEYSPINV